MVNLIELNFLLFTRLKLIFVITLLYRNIVLNSKFIKYNFIKNEVTYVNNKLLTKVIKLSIV